MSLQRCCVICGTVFNPRGNQHTCSAACSRKRKSRLAYELRWRGGEVLRSCTVCNAPFHPRGPQKTCSTACRTDEKIERSCVVCGTVFHPNTRAKACSPACSRQYKRADRRARYKVTYKAWYAAHKDHINKHKRERYEKVVRQCAVCNTTFNPLGNQKMCSPACSMSRRNARGSARRRVRYKIDPQYRQKLKVAASRWRRANSKRHLEYGYSWKRRHPEQVRQSTKRYRTAHREIINQKARAQRAANPGPRRAAHKKYRAKHLLDVRRRGREGYYKTRERQLARSQQERLARAVLRDMGIDIHNISLSAAVVGSLLEENENDQHS